MLDTATGRRRAPNLRSRIDAWSARLGPRLATFIILVMTAWGVPLMAQSDGTVQIPLSVYQELLSGGASSATPTYTLGNARVRAEVSESDAGPIATVRLEVQLRTMTAGPTLVPLLPVGTVVTDATAGGRAISLTPTPRGLAYVSTSAETVNLIIDARVEARSYADGRTLSIALPTVSSTNVEVSVPGVAANPSVIPSTTMSTRADGGRTVVTATVPTAAGVQISWGHGATASTAISRAVYRGAQVGDAIQWRAEFSVDVDAGGRAILPLVSTGLPLMAVTVDGVDAPILVRDGRFAVHVEGRGRHTVVASFETAIQRESGPPRVELALLPVPVSRFEVTLPGEKQITVTPSASVSNTFQNDTTTATFNVAMTDRVTLGWAEAVPDTDEAIEVRANASIYHTAFAADRVLTMRAMAEYEITRGETTQLSLRVPPDVQINQVSSLQPGVADWRVSGEADARVLTIFFDRAISGDYRISVEYERLLGRIAPEAEISVPIMEALDVGRQRGMVALLSSDELSLTPVREGEFTRVGENQLPGYILDQIEHTVAHTFRYLEPAQDLFVRTTVPERQEGRFDAQVDTLVSIGDVTTLGATTIEVNVKSGTIMGLVIELPLGVNFLNLSAPSMRSQQVTADEETQLINVEFTREMDGIFRIELAYERINQEGSGNLGVPLPRVRGAEVEQGRIAVEALAAVEVQPASSDHLQSLDIAELPRHLVLRTTNPILLAYKYVQADPRPSLALRATRHREIEVQAAMIDVATYRTLYTRDGFAVTTARYTVRNSRQQFLRVRLPEGSEVWSAMVNGVAETPALADSESAEPEVLIKIINATQGFPVELIYRTPVAPLGSFGQVRGTLPQPDMIVTETTWDVYLPDGLTYGDPTGEMEFVRSAHVEQGEVDDAAFEAAPGTVTLTVPTGGTRYSFRKLYANQTPGPVGFAVPYISQAGASAGKGLVWFGAFAFWFGVVALMRRKTFPTGLSLTAIVLGAAALVVAVTKLGAELDSAKIPSIIVLGGALLAGIVLWARSVLARQKEEGGTPPPPAAPIAPTVPPEDSGPAPSAPTPTPALRPGTGSDRGASTEASDGDASPSERTDEPDVGVDPSSTEAAAPAGEGVDASADEPYEYYDDDELLEDALADEDLDDPPPRDP